MVETLTARERADRYARMEAKRMEQAEQIKREEARKKAEQSAKWEAVREGEIEHETLTPTPEPTPDYAEILERARERAEARPSEEAIQRSLTYESRRELARKELELKRLESEAQDSPEAYDRYREFYEKEYLPTHERYSGRRKTFWGSLKRKFKEKVVKRYGGVGLTEEKVQAQMNWLDEKYAREVEDRGTNWGTEMSEFLEPHHTTFVAKQQRAYDIMKPKVPVSLQIAMGSRHWFTPSKHYEPPTTMFDIQGFSTPRKMMGTLTLMGAGVVGEAESAGLFVADIIRPGTSKKVLPPLSFFNVAVIPTYREKYAPALIGAGLTLAVGSKIFSPAVGWAMKPLTYTVGKVGSKLAPYFARMLPTPQRGKFVRGAEQLFKGVRAEKHVPTFAGKGLVQDTVRGQAVAYDLSLKYAPTGVVRRVPQHLIRTGKATRFELRGPEMWKAVGLTATKGKGGLSTQTISLRNAERFLEISRATGKGFMARKIVEPTTTTFGLTARGGSVVARYPTPTVGVRPFVGYEMVASKLALGKATAKGKIIFRGLYPPRVSGGLPIPSAGQIFERVGKPFGTASVWIPKLHPLAYITQAQTSAMLNLSLVRGITTQGLKKRLSSPLKTFQFPAISPMVGVRPQVRQRFRQRQIQRPRQIPFQAPLQPPVTPPFMPYPPRQIPPFVTPFIYKPKKKRKFAMMDFYAGKSYAERFFKMGHLFKALGMSVNGVGSPRKKRKKKRRRKR